MMAAKKDQLSTRAFLVAQLRDISESGDSTPSVRLAALDRLALVENVYVVTAGKAHQ
jgi:hypothetical protein